MESEDVKKKLFVQLDNIVKSSSILASNTSSISITRLASVTSRPSQVTHPIFNKYDHLIDLVVQLWLMIAALLLIILLFMN